MAKEKDVKQTATEVLLEQDQKQSTYVPDMKSDFNFAELALAEDELHRLKEETSTPEKAKWWQRLGDWYFARKENRQKHLVNRKVYIWLCVLTGLVGGHRFYEHRWGLGILYLALAITGLPVAFLVIDWMIAVPMKPDENGMIWI